jgi:hypothetical protein
LVELTWPDDPDAREQMREFVAELADCSSVDDAFAAGIGEDPDGEQRYQRPDLAATAQARLRAWGPEDDAPTRALELGAWLAQDVVGKHFPELPVTVPRSLAGGGAWAQELAPLHREADERWDEARRTDTEAVARLAWMNLNLLGCALEAA